MKKYIIAFACMIILLTGCTYRQEVVERDTETDTIHMSTGADEIKRPELTQTLAVKGEDFSLTCTYDLGNYNLSEWRVTDSKNVGMSVKTKDLPSGYEVYIDHVHADIVLKSTSTQIDGITQDSMDDTYHGISQDGFYIDDNSEYYNIFSIEGYTSQFYELWGYAFGNFGTMSSNYRKLTEGNIQKNGTYAEKLIVVYDLSIKKPGTDKMYTKSVISEMLIPISGDIKTEEVNAFTGKPTK